MVKVTLHGELGNEMGKIWNLNVLSVGEAVRAIEANTRKFYKYLLEKDKENTKYQVLINGDDFISEEKIDVKNLESIKNSELCMNKENLKSVDIIPVLEGAGKDTAGIISVIAGVILVVVGIVLTAYGVPIGPYVTAFGVALIGAGLTYLLSQPPKFEDFRDIETGGKTSYLFSGPENIIGEGGPVPVGYGRLLVGSQVVSAAYVVQDFDTNDITRVVRDEYGNLSVSPRPRLAREDRISNRFLR